MPAVLRRLVSEAYRMIGDATPLPVDCGQLCGGACCKGDEHTGMLLFPGEAVLLSGVPGYKFFRMPYMGGKAWLLICEGRCDRSLRPLACRIFPLAPHVDENGVVTAVPDLRARPMCPLADGSYLDRRFRRRVSEAFELLAQNPKMLDFMRRVSAEIDELAGFY